jgi:hypothetical protein
LVLFLWEVDVRKLVATTSTTVSNTAVAITAAAWGWDANDLNRARRALISPIGADVVIRWDGTAPTATAGHVVLASREAPYPLEGNGAINGLQLIRMAGDDAEVTITLEL